jgi:UDP-N-acetylglucosamine 4,6-dehydratase/5-epimerase
MLDGKNILVTGGTGSFGKKFTEVLLRDHNPRKVIIFSRDELKQHEMQRSGFNDPRLRFFIGDVRDKGRLVRAMNGVDIVVHAAALKQVPACEYNPIEAINTNVNGARNVIDAAIDTGVEIVVGLSTDKAVNPANLYGATKLCMEKLFVQSNAYSGGVGTRFSIVRYGNVVGSRGSVIPVFKKQKESGTLTVTDPRMTRFWITLEQGVKFVINAMTSTQGGEIFIPKIPSMNIVSLAKVIAPEAELSVIGIRPGEKLHECLLSEDEARYTYEFDNQYIIHPHHSWWDAAIPEGSKQVPEGFSYVSCSNEQWLSLEALATMVG